MANDFDLVTIYQPILDEIYKEASKTAIMDAPTKLVDFAGASVVKVYKTTLTGLGTYSRADGYPVGDVDGSWETLTLATERGRELGIDRMDDDETLLMAFSSTIDEFMRTIVVPEVDAYRFAAFAGWSNISGTTGTLDATSALDAFDAAMLQLDEDEVPSDGRKMFISHTCLSYLKSEVTRILENQSSVDRRVKSLDGVDIIPVPQSRFSTAVTLDAGATSSAGGWSATGNDINFILLHPSAILQTKKHEKMKIFSPDVNQDADKWKIQYRLYHDAFVYENKVDGVYLHAKAS